MNEIFNSNNPAMRFLTNLFNIAWVNLIFLFTCLPIITIGPSLCALYKVCLLIVSGQDPIVATVYFTEFKNSFKKGTIMWLGVLVLSILFGIELYGIYFRPDLVSENLKFLQYPVWVMIFLVAQVFLYGFALLAMFENSLINTIKNAVLLSIKNFMITILLLVIWLFTPLMMNTFQGFILGFLVFELFFNMALRVYICSIFLHRAFGLKRFKFDRRGGVTEVIYDENGNPVEQAIDDSDYLESHSEDPDDDTESADADSSEADKETDNAETTAESSDAETTADSPADETSGKDEE